MNLSHRDLSRILERLPELYSAQDFKDFLQAMFNISGALISCDSQNFNDLQWVDPPQLDGRELETYPAHYEVAMHHKKMNMFVAAAPLRTDLPVDEVCYGFEKNVQEHPTIIACRKSRGYHTWRVSELISDRHFLQSRLYAEFYSLFPIRKLIISYLGYGPQPREVVFCAAREKGREFSERDRDVIAALNPHLRQAWQNAIALEEARTSLEQSRTILHTLRVACVTLNANLEMEWCSPEAEGLLAEFFPGRRRKSSCLPESLLSWVKAHPHARAKSFDSGHAKPFCLLSLSARLEVRLSFDGSTGRTLFLKRQSLILSAEGFTFPGLTARESEVLYWIAQGRTNGAIATLLSSSPRTINKHIQSIFQKMGVGNRAEAIVAAHSILSAANQ
jgi:DNA-binding CsgD family transcriptional regulator